MLQSSNLITNQSTFRGCLLILILQLTFLLTTHDQIFNSLTLSQWKDFKMGVICVDLGALTTAQAREFISFGSVGAD